MKDKEASTFNKKGGSLGELPHGPHLGTADAPIFHKRSPGGAQEVANKTEVNEGKRTAEEELHHNVLESLKGKGQELLHELEANENMVFLLQETPKSHRGRARCRAEDCVSVQVNNPNSRYITDDYCIYVDKGRSYKHYYYVLCFECMIDLRELILSRFKIAGAS